MHLHSPVADITGRTEITVSDDRFKCATVTLVKAADNSTLLPHGTITIDFGTGCLGPGGKNRVGKIVVEYKGRRFLPGSKIKTLGSWGYRLMESPRKVPEPYQYFCQ